MPPPRYLPALAALLVLGSLWAVAPASATHDGEFNGNLQGASNHTYGTLTVRNVAGGRLSNATATTNFYLGASSNLTIETSSVGRADTASAGLWIYDLKRTSYSRSTIHGVLYVNASQDLEFRDVTLNGDVRIISSKVHFNNATFKKCVQVEGASNVTFAGASPCVTHPDPTPTPKPTTHADCVEGGQFVPCPTSSSTPTPTKPTTAPYESYVYELVDQRLAHDVYVRGADKVLLRNSAVLGSVYIGSSANVILENVDISGSLHVDRTNGVEALGVNVGGDVGLSMVKGFRFAGAAAPGVGEVGGHLGCLGCTDGVFLNLRVGGMVEIRESTNVEQLNVVGGTTVTFTHEASPSPAPGALLLNVSQEGFAFTHEAEIRDAGVPVVLDYNPVEARARLALSTQEGQPQLQLESRFEKIVEFEDRNGDGGYDLSDLVLREYLIEDLKASLSQERLGEGQEGWRGRIDYALPGGGTFSLIFTATDADPDDTKIDVAFTDYRYETESAQLALQVRLASASDWDMVAADAEERLVFHGEGVDGYFGWLHTVVADGSNASVTARVLEEHRGASGEREVVLYLAYPHAENLLHDPSIGLLQAAIFEIPQLGNLVVYGTTLLAVLVVLWALGQSGRRRGA